MKKFELIILVLSLGLAGSVWAQGNDPKIGTVDTLRILRDSAPAQRASKKLEKEFESRKNELQRQNQQAKNLQTLLDRNNLSDNDRKQKERELVKVMQDLQRMEREVNEDNNIRRNEEIVAIQEKAKVAIKQIAEAEKFDLILNDQEVIYRAPRLDITDKVLKLLADK